MAHPEPSETHSSITLSISCLDMFSSGSISLGFVIALALPLKNAFLYISEVVLLMESVVIFFTNVTSKVSMNLNPFMSFNRLSKCDSMNALVLVKWFNRFK